MGDIQNSALGEQRIRDLNDELNEMMKEKRRWEERIRKLGGPDYRKIDKIYINNIFRCYILLI